MVYYWLYLKNLVKDVEDGIETIEWIALAAVILALLMGMLFLMKPFGIAVGAQIFGKISEWIGKW
jgi:uncharacterized membrane protein